MSRKSWQWEQKALDKVVDGYYYVGVGYKPHKQLTERKKQYVYTAERTYTGADCRC